MRAHALQVLPLAAHGIMMIANGMSAARARARYFVRLLPGKPGWR